MNQFLFNQNLIISYCNMAFAFKTPQAKPTFGEFKEPLDAGEYILKKKASTTFCKPYKCPGKPRISSQGDYILLNAAKNNINDRLSLSFNKANLYINLLTTLDLKRMLYSSDKSVFFKL